MGGWLKMALLLCLVAAGSSVPLPTHPVTSEQFQLITNAIELLNFAAKGAVFRLLFHDVRLDATRGPQHLNFTIKETECFIREKSEKENLEECDFKDGGIVKECSVSFFTGQELEAPVVNCTTLEQKNESTRPPQLRFTLKETECLKSENKTVEECDIREGGTTKVCSLSFLVEMERNTIMINCDSSIHKGTRERRWIWPFKRKKKPKPGVYSSIASGKGHGSGRRGTILAK